MLEYFYDSLLNFARKVERGLALGVMDGDLGIEKKVKPNIKPVYYEIKEIKYGNTSLVGDGRN